MKKKEQKWWFLIGGIGVTIVFIIDLIWSVSRDGFGGIIFGFVGFGVGGTLLYEIFGLLLCWIGYYEIYKIEKLGFDPDTTPKYNSDGKRIS